MKLEELRNEVNRILGLYQNVINNIENISDDIDQTKKDELVNEIIKCIEKLNNYLSNEEENSICIPEDFEIVRKEAIEFIDYGLFFIDKILNF